jgi:hypothetical protein
MGAPATTGETVGQIVSLRRVWDAVESPADRRRLARVLRQLRRQLGVAAPKRQAAACLGVTVQALDRWVAAGRIPVVRRPGSSRELIAADALLVLAEEVERRREQGEPRPLAGAIAALTERESLPRRLRPNQPAHELRYEFLHSTPAGRMRQAIELSELGADLAARAHTRKQKTASP